MANAQHVQKKHTFSIMPIKAKRNFLFTKKNPNFNKIKVIVQIKILIIKNHSHRVADQKISFHH
ncbi:hypothetical protein Q668_17360 [Alcanivorax sp. PN-3]|nr:hypothetical protein Q668_17360 [Alcanivorax sp. PN-3]